MNGLEKAFHHGDTKARRKPFYKTLCLRVSVVKISSKTQKVIRACEDSWNEHRYIIMENKINAGKITL